MDPRLTNPQAVADLGEKIYAERYKEKYEKLYSGQFAAIDVESGVAHIGVAPEDAVQQARRHNPRAILHIIRIGAPGAFRVSYSAKTALRHRVSR